MPQSKIEIALEQAAERVISAVAEAFADSATASAGAASSGSSQSTTGAVAGTGGSTGQSGQVTQGAAGEVKTKDDVAAPEVIEALNVQGLKDTAICNKMMVDNFGARSASNNKLFDVTATSLGMLTLGSTHNQSLHQQMGTDHRDQNHDRQININETDLYATVAGAVTAAVMASLGKEAQK
jgi:hypothetical protein